jgi:hypothetical protein
MIGPAGFGQAPSEPAECAEMTLASMSEEVASKVREGFAIPPHLFIEPGHVMSVKTYERLFGKQK